MLFYPKVFSCPSTYHSKKSFASRGFHFASGCLHAKKFSTQERSQIADGLRLPKFLDGFLAQLSHTLAAEIDISPYLFERTLLTPDSKTLGHNARLAFIKTGRKRVPKRGAHSGAIHLAVRRLVSVRNDSL